MFTTSISATFFFPNTRTLNAPTRRPENASYEVDVSRMALSSRDADVW